jgi:hypothetical protein
MYISEIEDSENSRTCDVNPGSLGTRLDHSGGYNHAYISSGAPLNGPFLGLVKQSGRGTIRVDNITSNKTVTLQFPDKPSGTYTIATTSDATYKVYSALLTQTGVNAPTAIVLENTLGGAVTFTYVSPGVYTINSSSLFTVDKTSVIAGNLGLYVTGYSVTNTTTTINLFTSSPSGYQDEGLIKTFLEIRVYK